MTQKLLSIVTISFNQKKYLPSCIESIVSQKDDRVEYIVVDPGSIDGSRAIIDEYRDKIDEIVYEPDNGPASGLNNGFSKASGKYGYFINSDDIVLPGGLKKLLDSLEQNDVGLLFSHIWMIDALGRPLRALRSRRPKLKSLLRGDSALLQQGTVFEVAKFKDLEGFNEQNETCWDLELVCAMLARDVPVTLLPSFTGAFRMTGENLSSSTDGSEHQSRFLRDFMRIRNQYGFRYTWSEKVASRVILPSTRVFRDRYFLEDKIKTLSPFYDVNKHFEQSLS